MKRRFLPLLKICAFILGTLLFSNKNLEAKTNISPSNSNIQYIGRFDMTDPSSPKMWFTGLEICANFTGTSISAIFTGDATYFNVLIDGNLSSFCFAGKGDVICPLAVDLVDTLHTVRIIKRSSPWLSQHFKGFILDDAKSLASPPTRKKRKIEFYGDSMTQGAQVDVPGIGPDLNDIMYDNNYHSYATMAARALNAESSIIARNGATMVPKSKWTDIPSVYNRVAFDTNAPLWDFDKWQADVVVINLGENDDPLPASFTSTYIDFVTNIRSKYPNAQIFLLAGPLWNGIDQEHCDAIEAVVDSFKSNGDKKIYFYKFKKDVRHPGHNRTADNIICSDELVAKIKTIIWQTP